MGCVVRAIRAVEVAQHWPYSVVMVEAAAPYPCLFLVVAVEAVVECVPVAAAAGAPAAAEVQHERVDEAMGLLGSFHHQRCLAGYCIPNRPR